MAKYERERKFLLKKDTWEEWKNKAIDKKFIIQGYLSKRKESTVRIRISGENAWITIKGITIGDTREEYEYSIPLDDAKNMLKMCVEDPLEKTRWIIPWEDMIFEIDIFSGSNEGLCLCEVELKPEQTVTDLPPFVGEEVTGIPAYYNSNL